MKQMIENIKYYKWPIIIGLAILYLIPIYVDLINYWLPLDWDKKGQFGDMFGALNVILTGIAFTVTVITLRMQMKDIKESHKEAERSNTILAIENYIRTNETVAGKREIILMAKETLNELTEELLSDNDFIKKYSPKFEIRSLKKEKNGLFITINNTGIQYEMIEKKVSNGRVLFRNTIISVEFENEAKNESNKFIRGASNGFMIKDLNADDLKLEFKLSHKLVRKEWKIVVNVSGIESIPKCQHIEILEI